MIGSNNIIGKCIEKKFLASLPVNVTDSTTASTTKSYTSGRLITTGGSGSISNFTEKFTMSGVSDIAGSCLLEQWHIFSPQVNTGLGFACVWTSTLNFRFDPVSKTVKINVSGVDVATTAVLTYTATTDILYMRNTWNKRTGVYSTEFGIYSKKSANLISVVRASFAGSLVASYLINPSISFFSGTIKHYEYYAFDYRSVGGKIFCNGDSITFGVGSVGSGTDWVSIQQDSTRDDIDMFAVPGINIAGLSNYIQIVLDARPEYLLLMIGTNDHNVTPLATFMASLTAYVNTVVANGSKVILQSILPNNTANYTNIPTFNTAISGLANGSTILYIDMFTPMNNGSGQLSVADSADGTHLTNVGQAKLAAAQKVELSKLFIL